MKKIYDKICSFFSTKKIAWITVIVFIILMLPIFYLSFINRASGDDYGYGTYTRAAWVSSHSLVKVWKAICRTIRQYYYGWQGTWFSILVFSLQPEVFHPKAYVITVFLMLFLWIGSTGLLFKEVLYKKLKLDKSSVWLTAMLFFILCMEFIPSTKSAIFWFNGAAHYMLPFTMCQLLVVLLFRYEEKFCIRYLVGSSVLMTLLGGSNYQAALFALIAAVYIGGFSYLQKRDKKVFLLFIPIVLEMIGLIISIKAPGNKVRGGEEFGFSVAKGAETIGASFAQGVVQAFTYVKEKPLVFVGLFFIFLLLAEAFLRRKEQVTIKYPVLLGILFWCLYSAMQAPEIYAGVDVSSGVYNMNYQTFMLAVGAILLLLAEKTADKIKKKQNAEGNMSLKQEADSFHGKIVLPGIVICLLLLVVFRSNIKESTTYISLAYITSGQAADYKEQMDLQTSLLMDENTKDVVLPMINDVQGPLMHMPVTEQEDAWTNTVTKDFYGKNSVIGMPRTEWLEIYGD